MGNRVKKEQKTFRYRSYTDDFVESKNQSFQLPDEYVWIRKNILYRITSGCLYLLAVIFSFFFSKFYLHVKIKNGSALKQCNDRGYFVFGNHTQPVGDVFVPARTYFPKRCYVIADPSNLGIPVLGKLMPMLGALPLPHSMTGMKKLHQAVRYRIRSRNCVVIYPEAHVWPWYTGIRPFSAVSFGFPVECDAPSFCMTTTYQKRRYGKKPKITLYLDGPFYPDLKLSKKEQKEKLRDEIYGCMKSRSQSSDFQYIDYVEDCSEA